MHKVRETTKAVRIETVKTNTVVVMVKYNSKIIQKQKWCEL